MCLNYTQCISLNREHKPAKMASQNQTHSHIWNVIFIINSVRWEFSFWAAAIDAPKPSPDKHISGTHHRTHTVNKTIKTHARVRPRIMYSRFAVERRHQIITHSCDMIYDAALSVERARARARNICFGVRALANIETCAKMHQRSNARAAA